MSSQLAGRWVLVTAKPWPTSRGIDGVWDFQISDRREVLGRCDKDDGVGIFVQPIEHIGRELVEGALYFVPWEQVLQVVSAATQEALRGVVGMP